MKFVVLFACAALAVPAIAQEAAPSTPAAAPAAPVKEKKICRTLTVTGSIMGKRECRPLKEWRQIDDANAERAHRALDGRAGNAPARN